MGSTTPPSYLEDYADTYAEDPRSAAMEWFEDARYGLFLHYGLYSLLGNHEWVQYNEEIPPGEYAQLQDYFTAEGFDAEAIAEFARDAGMEYVTLTSRHCESFCLWDTDQTTFNSVEAPAGRDLVGELAEACHEAGLGLFLYYVHGFEWRHPHAPTDPETYFESVRPDYEDPTIYATAGHNLDIYLDFVESQITELLTEYGPIAGIWLDGVAGVHNAPDIEQFRLPELYETIRGLQPQTLISYKDGVTGAEDFLAYEAHWDYEDVEGPLELCKTMIPNDHPHHSWGYMRAAADEHHTEEEVWKWLREAADRDANLLLNTGPLPDGSLDPEDTKTLRAVGDRIEREGLPTG